MSEALLPFICECADPNCTAVTQLSRGDYEEIRANPAWFLNVPGHETAAEDYARVVKTSDRYVIVEKIEQAGQVAKELDQRRAEPAERDEVA